MTQLHCPTCGDDLTDIVKAALTPGKRRPYFYHILTCDSGVGCEIEALTLTQYQEKNKAIMEADDAN